MSRRRSWVVVVIVIAVAGGGAGLAGSQSPGVVYSGLSAQRLPFSLSVAADGQTLSLDLTWRASCGRVVRTIRPVVTTIAASGDFAWSGTHVDALDDGDEDRHRLRLIGRREADGALAGVWRGERDSYNGQGRTVDSTCSSGDVAFHISRDGSTSQPAPQRDGAGHLVVALDEEPDLVAVGAGRTWVHGHAATVSSAQAPATTVTEVDPQTGHATATRLDDEIGHGVVDLAAGEGAAWLLKADSPARLLRLDARTHRVVAGPRLPISADGGYPAGLAVGAGGVWVLLDGPRVGRADPRDGRVVRTIRVPVDRRFPRQRRCARTTHVTHIAIHRDAIWIMSRSFMSCRSHASSRAFALARKGPLYSLARIDGRTNRVTRAVALPREYGALAAGPSGVWGIGCEKPDVATSRLETVRAIPRLPADLAVDDRGVWVLDGLDRTLIGVQP